MNHSPSSRRKREKVEVNSGIADASDVRDVLATVIAVIPEIMQAKVMTKNGFRYSITRRTPGVDVAKLCEGQQLMCTVTMRLPRLLYARMV